MTDSIQAVAIVLAATLPGGWGRRSYPTNN